MFFKSSSVWDAFDELFGPTWPPYVGHGRGLLDTFNVDLDVSRKSEWSKDEWQQYAEFLEKGGQELKHQIIQLKQQLRQTEKDLFRAKARGAQRKKPAKPIIRLLSYHHDEQSSKKKPGRKSGSQYDRHIEYALQLLSEAKARGSKLKTIDAARQSLKEIGGTRRSCERTAKTISKRISEKVGRKNTNNS